MKRFNNLHFKIIDSKKQDTFIDIRTITVNVNNDQPFLFDYLYRWKEKSFPDDY